MLRVPGSTEKRRRTSTVTSLDVRDGGSATPASCSVASRCAHAAMIPSAGVPAESAASRSEAFMVTALASASRSRSAAVGGLRCALAPGGRSSARTRRYRQKVATEDEDDDGGPPQEDGDRVTVWSQRPGTRLAPDSGSYTGDPSAGACCLTSTPGRRPRMTRAGRGTAAAHTAKRRVSTPSAAITGGRPSAVTTAVRDGATHPPNQNGAGAGDVLAVTIGGW